MAIVRAGGEFALRMDRLDISNFFLGTLVTQTNRLVRISYPDNYFSEIGGDFLFDAAGALAGGQINSFRDYFGALLIAEITEFSVSATAFYNWALNRQTFTAISTILSGDDTITGSRFDDYLIGYDGNDHITAGQGFNTIDGSAGFDTVSYADATVGVTVNLSLFTSQSTGWSTDRLISIERIVGSNFNDVLTGSTGSDELIGGAGNDQLSGGSGNDILVGGAGADTMDGGSGDDTYYLDDANDQVIDTSGFDTIVFAFNFFVRSNGSIERYVLGAGVIIGEGSSFSETIEGNTLGNTILGLAGDDILRGFAGDDFLRGGAGNDIIDGGLGFDTATYSDSTIAVTVNLGISTAQVTGLGTDTLISIEHLIGSSFADRLTGSAGNDLLDGGDGDDIIDGGAGRDRFIMSGVAGTVDLNLTTAQDTGHGRDILIGIEDVTGTTGNDTLIGDSNANVLDGGAGNDLLIGGFGNDTIIGGAGVDIAAFSGRRSGSSFSYANGAIAVTGANGSDTLQSIETLQFADGLFDVRSDGTVATAARVTFAGTANADVVRSGDSNDVLLGGAGNDILDAGIGTDRLDGGTGNDTLTGGAGDDGIEGGSGTDTAIFSGASTQATFSYVNGTIVVDGPDGRDVLTGIEQLRFSDRVLDIGADGRVITALNTVNGTAAADTLTGTSGSDALQGGAGNDILRGQGGSDVINGGDGVDAAAYSGVRRQYGANSTSVSGGPEGGTDTLVSIEEARFVDGVLSFDVDGIAAQVMRLYDATLDRQPDQAGLDVQIRALATGATTLQALANAFVASAEFQGRYGTLSNQQFVEQLYRFCLDREGDAAGIAVQVNALNTGTSRAALVVAFSESPEHRTLTQPFLSAGLWVADEKALQIARLYDATLDRLPDAVGLAGQLRALDSGTSLLQLAANFVGSAEFQARYGALSNQQFVEQLYRFCLDREGDPAGIAVQVNALNTGTSRAQLVLAFSESGEHIALTAPLYSGGIRTTDPTFNGSPVQDESGKPVDGQPLVLIQADDTMPVTKAEEAQVLPGTVTYDPAQIVVGFKLVDDAFVLPPQDDLTPLVLPEADLLDTIGLEQVSLPALTGNRMLTLPMSEDGTPDDATPWHRGTDTDGWMMQ